MKTLVAIVLTMLIVSCGEKQKNAPPAPVVVPTIDGMHFAGCGKKGDLPARDALKIAGKEYVLQTTLYDKDDCTSPNALSRITARIDSDTPTTVPAAARQIDLTVTAVELTLLDPGQAHYWNEQKMCGQDGWVAGKPQTVSGKQCLETDMPLIGEQRYNIYQLRSDDSLLFGKSSDEQDGKKGERRPRELDETKVFAKAAS